MADSDPLEESTTNDAVIYGIIDAIYPDESRVVIGDISIKYDNQSNFKNLFGRVLSGSEKTLKPGTMVRYRIANQGKTPLIQELEVISKRKYQFETTRQHADNY